MKSIEEVMEILKAYDLTQTFEAAARLSGCDAKTVARYVQLRDQEMRPDGARFSPRRLSRQDRGVGRALAGRHQSRRL